MDAYMFLLCKYSSFTPKMQGRRMGTSGRAITKSTSVSGEMYTLEHTDGSQSDTAVGTVGAGGKKRRSSLSAKVVAIVSRRSRSTSQLSHTGEWSEFNLNISSSCQRNKNGPSGLWWDCGVYSFFFAKEVYYFCLWKSLTCMGLLFFSIQLSYQDIIVNQYCGQIFSF